VRPFCAAITCLSRVGKEIYIDFDPMDGLTLRSLNDAKSVFASFQYQPSFFDRCSAVDSGISPNGNGRKRKSSQHRNNDGAGVDDSGDDDDENDAPAASLTQENRYSVRLACKALLPVVKTRRQVLSLRIVSSSPELSATNSLDFEFQYSNHLNNDDAIVNVIHRIGVSDAQGVAAVIDKEDASELVVAPSVLLRMLEPLKRTAELALIVNDTHKLVTTVTFHQEDVQATGAASASNSNTSAGGINGNSAAVTATQRNTSIKTETSINYDDLIEYEYNGHPEIDNANSNDGTASSGNNSGTSPPPDDLSEQVILVFNMKEFRSVLQFCSQAYTDQELDVSINFFWGGKPLVVEASDSSVFKCQLVMATLDHTLLRAMDTTSGGGAS